MKAISLSQPWASLVASGAKKFETRSWPSHYRGPLLIHAAKRISPEARVLSSTEPFRTALKQTPYWSLQRGVVIAVVSMTGCLEIRENLFSCGLNEVLERGTWELLFGDYSAGRFAWQFSEVMAFPEPFFAKGCLGLFDVPDRTIALATEDIDGHEEWYDGPCFCKLCMTYADL